MDRVKQEFVRRVLEEESSNLNKAQLLRISKYLTPRTGRLENRNVVVNSGNDSMDGKLTLFHPDYERYLDMKRKSNNKEILRKRDKNGRFLKSRRENGFPIHNSPIMLRYNIIGNKLLYFLTQDVYEQIRQELQSNPVML